MAARHIKTRFRAYQLGSAGSSFSYVAGDHLTLIEARLTDTNRKTVRDELDIAGKETIDRLHITSWDRDHCDPDQLQEILETFRPRGIEHPGYDPHTDCGEESLKLIQRYGSKKAITPLAITPAYIEALESASQLGYNDILYGPRVLADNSNDNSVVKLFRRGSFAVLSLGDVDHAAISAALRRQQILSEETDVLLLAHHGADNGFTTTAFLKHVRPQLAICSSNYDNHFEHPKPEIRELLYERDIPLFTTKTGDVIIASTEPHDGAFLVTNLKAGSTEISSQKHFVAKKRSILQMNPDSLRQHYRR